MSVNPEHPPNRLSEETSPYLRQHMRNPVDWYPWGAEALGRAKREDKPIFLSIGYAACHWCHVMAHESFEDEATAAFLNGHFVAIKLDREERPDLDALYMRAVTLMTGQGGWPLSVFLTPALEPFFGGTYFPREPQWGMPSFRQVLEGTAGAYEERRGEVLESAASLVAALAASFQVPEAGKPPGPEASEAAARAISQRLDPEEGGFGRGPKFPQPPLLEFLLDEAARTGDKALADRVLFALDRMEAGGVRDQVGGGFHRYSVDGAWRVPHYEKMLYDNAQLAALYSRAFELTGNAGYGRVAREILGDLRASMASPGGGFIAALDADSEGEEGKFYLWTPREIAEVLGPEEGSLVTGLYGITSASGLEHGTPHRRVGWTVAARSAGQNEAIFVARVREDLDRLRSARALRVPPGADGKVLTDWNALAAQAFLESHRATAEEPDLATGLETLERLWERAWRGGVLFHVWDGTTAKVPGFLADYAYLSRAEWAAFEATGEGEHLSRVGRLLESAAARFGSGPSGAWVDAPASPEEGGLILAVRDASDGVLPSPLFVVARVLWLWERLTGPCWAGEALDGLLNRESGALTREPGAQPLLAGLAADRALPPVEVVVSAPDIEAALPLLRAARRAAPHGALVLPLTRSGLAEAEAERYSLFRGRGGGSTARAFACVGGSCGLPVTSEDELAERLQALRPNRK